MRHKNGKIIITDTIDLEVNDQLYSKWYGISLPLTIINKNDDYTSLNVVKSVDSILLNGKSIVTEPAQENLKNYYTLNGNTIDIGNFIFDNIGLNTLQYTYTCENYNIVTNYNNLTSLKFNKNTYFNNYLLKVSLPKKTDIFKVRNLKAKLTQFNDTDYLCDIKKNSFSGYENYFEVLIDSDILNYGKQKDSNYYINKIITRAKSENLDGIFIEELSEIPFVRVFPSQANYVMCELTDGCDSRKIAEELLEKNILIKDLTGKIGNGRQYIRLAVRTVEENHYLVEQLRRLK